MKSHPDVGTDSSCISALPLFAQWDLGLFLLQGQACTLAGTLGLQQSVFTLMFPQYKQRVCWYKESSFSEWWELKCEHIECVLETDLRKLTATETRASKITYLGNWGSWLWPSTSAALHLNPLGSEQPPQVLLGSTTHFRQFKMTLMLRFVVSLTPSQCQTKNFLCWISHQIHGSSFSLLFLLNIPAFYVALHVKSNAVAYPAFLW